MKALAGILAAAVVVLALGWVVSTRGGVTADQVALIVRGELERSRVGPTSRPTPTAAETGASPQADAIAALEERVGEILWRLPAPRFDSYHLAEAPADAWPMFRGNHQLTGVSATTLPDQPDVLWRYDAGEAIESSAAIVGGLVFFGAFDGKFHCVDLESGEPRWVRTFRKDEFADPEDRPTTAPARVEFVPAIYSSPAVAEGRVFFGDEMGNFYALDAWTGRTLWKFEAQGDIRSSPNVIGETVMIGSGDGHVYNLDVATGELVWKFATDDQIRCVPGTADGLTYIAGCDGFIRGIDIATGEQMMSLPIGSQMGASPAMHRGKLFAGIYGNAVIGVDLRDPKVIWAYDPPRKDFPFEASAAIARDRIVIGGKDKAVHCIDLETGAPIWQFETGAAVISSPIVVGDRAFIGSGDGKLYALDLQSGELKWSFETGAAVTASPAAALGRLIVGDVNGILYCFGERGAR